MILRAAKAIARRAAIVAGGFVVRRTGWFENTTGSSGVRIWLLHNSLPPQAEKLLHFIRSNRSQFIDFRDAVAMVRGNHAMPSRTLYALTFDDGFQSNLAMARALANEGLSACFYVPTGVVGLDKTQSDRFFRSQQLEGVMGWGDLEELLNLGHSVGTHSIDHVPLASLDEAEAEAQVKASVETLRVKLGRCDDYAWPFGALHHADAPKVAHWCDEIDVVPSSGVRGRNDRKTWEACGYLLRDNIDLDWIAAETAWFFRAPPSIKKGIIPNTGESDGGLAASTMCTKRKRFSTTRILNA